MPSTITPQPARAAPAFVRSGGLRRFRPLVVGWVLAAVGTTVAQPVDVLILAADVASLQPLLDRLAERRVEHRGAWTCWTGRLAGQSVALTRTEGDPLNAVAATSLAVHRHRPGLIVTYGTSRAHDPALQPGDLVVSEKFAAFDGCSTPRTGLQGGSDALRWTHRPHELLSPDGSQETETPWVEPDPVARAQAAALPWARGRVRSGVLGSASQVNQEADRVAWLRAAWGTSCEDGESGHIAICARVFGLPVVGLRVIQGEGADVAPAVLALLEARR